MKAFCLAIAFLLASLPAVAEELPQTGNAWRATEPELAEPGSYQWTVVNDAAGEANAPAAATENEVAAKSAPARAALAQVREETQRIMSEARKNGTKISRIRYDLRLRCVVEQVEVEPAVPAEVALPYIWGSDDEKISASDEDQDPTTGTLELCEVDYSQKVRSNADKPKAERAPELIDFKVALPVN